MTAIFRAGVDFQALEHWTIVMQRFRNFYERMNLEFDADADYPCVIKVNIKSDSWGPCVVSVLMRWFLEHLFLGSVGFGSKT